MSDDLESRLKALEDKFVLPVNKMSTMRASSDLKDILDNLKVDSESQEDVVWRLIGEAEKVPILFDENAELKKKITERDMRIRELEEIVES